MKIEPMVIFDDRNAEIVPLERAFSAHSILERHLDLLKSLEPELATRFEEMETDERHQIVTLMELVRKSMHGCSRMSEIPPKRIRWTIKALQALRTACEREKTWDYGAQQFSKVIVEARDMQIELVDEALKVLAVAEAAMAAIEEQMRIARPDLVMV